MKIKINSMVILILLHEQGEVGEFACATLLRNTKTSPSLLDGSGNCKDNG
jgi:hypothetical protein